MYIFFCSKTKQTLKILIHLYCLFHILFHAWKCTIISERFEIFLVWLFDKSFPTSSLNQTCNRHQNTNRAYSGDLSKGRLNWLLFIPGRFLDINCDLLTCILRISNRTTFHPQFQFSALLSHHQPNSIRIMLSREKKKLQTLTRFQQDRPS